MITFETRTRVREELYESGAFSRSFGILLVLSVVMATIGLITNNAATVIGAMIIAPLMNTILSMSMGITRGEWKKVVHMGGVLLCSTVLAIVVGMGVTLLIPGIPPTEELLARAHPTVLDLVVALVAGAVGAYAISLPKISSSIAGVAIAIALVPPLGAVGYGIARMHWSFAQGAVLLYLSNFLGILFAGIIVFALMGQMPHHHQEREDKRRGVVVSLLGIGTVMVLLGISLWNTIGLADLEYRLKDTMTNYLTGIAKEYEVRRIQVQKNREVLEVTAEVQAPQELSITEGQREKLLEILRSTTGQEIRLEMQILPYVRGGTEGQWVLLGEEVGKTREELLGKLEAQETQVKQQLESLNTLKERIESLELTEKKEPYEGIFVLPSVERIPSTTGAWIQV